MKTPRFFLLAGLSLATMLTISCDAISKGIDDLKGDLQESLKFDSLKPNNLLQGGGNQLGFMTSQEGVPDGNVDVITEVKIAGSALAGGSTIITVKASEELEELYIEIGGEEGFYRWNLEPEDFIGKDGSDYVYQIVLQFNQEQRVDDDCVVDRNTGVCTATRTFIVSGKTKAGELVVPEEEQLVIKQVGTGALQISISWDQLDDVDLNVYTPSEEKLFWNHLESDDGSGKLDVDANMGCNKSDTKKWGVNAENVFFDSVEDGEYTIVVHLFQRCPDNIRVNTEDGAKFNVTVNGELVNSLKGQKFSDTEPGKNVLLPIPPQTSSTSYAILVGYAVVENGKYKEFRPASN